jgi:D-3-phosphoglycerate dehydrogenase / 2-oxoglutarate reductase
VRRLQAFKCRLLVHDPVVSAEDIRKQGCEPVDFNRLLSQSDLVTLHCPAIAATRGMMSREAFARMRPGAFFINVARGTLVDSASLLEALQSGRLAGAGLDVFDPEPMPANSPLLKMDNVVVAAHLAACSEKALRTLRETAANIIARSLRGEPLINIVNGV